MQLHHVLTRLLLILALLPMTTLSATEYELRTIATGLDKPWSIAAIDGDALLVQKKRASDQDRCNRGRHHHWGTPEVYFANQGGLLEVLPDPASPKIALCT